MVDMSKLTEDAYLQAKERCDASKAHWERYAVGKHKSCLPADAPPDPANNSDRDIVEMWQFKNENTGSAGYMGYWHQQEGGCVITNWLGSTLGIVVTSSEYETPTFGRRSKRVAFTMKGIDGHFYSGVYFKSSGDYCSMKRIKQGSRRHKELSRVRAMMGGVLTHTA